jgi:hypothetical protein
MNFDASLSYFEGLGNEPPTVVTKKNFKEEEFDKAFLNFTH